MSKYLSSEGIILLEKAAKMGVPFPQKLKALLQNKPSSDA
ncbi:hypothetical protein GJ688_13270 [Heliobacillus mobilis]|uniref:Uncharacterized protein n=1 Tax=Heliobacterium mobile TaxID=28064 RepID=A0A6I3SLW9_HELMO|nr:phage holin family protein [Heliobacterium mobile]MTV49944.1 hypothetical protein [Heliobacterium mobile]